MIVEERELNASSDDPIEYEVYEQVEEDEEKEQDGNEVQVIVVEEELMVNENGEVEAAVASLNEEEQVENNNEEDEEEPPAKKARSKLTECPLCGYRERNIPKHIVWCKKLLHDYWTLRNTNPNSHKCHICMYATTRRASLKEHLERHDQGQTRAKNYIRIQYYELFTQDPQ